MAIKVNGTNVITDARALNNITGADTATKNALAAAGVGGKTTLITDSTFGTVSSVSVDFTGGHDYYRIHLKDCTHAGGASQTGFKARLKNSSGSVISSGEYLSDRSAIGANSYGDDFDTYWSFANETIIGTVKHSLFIDVINPYQTNQSTVYFGYYLGGLGSSGTYLKQFNVTGQLYSSTRNNAQHNGMVFYLNAYGSSQNFTGGRVTMWGVDV